MTNAASTQVQNHFLDLSADLMCIVAFDGSIQYLNPAWEKLLGYSKKEILSEKFIDLLFKKGNNTIEKESFNLLEGKLPSHFESTLECKNGCLKNIQWSSETKPIEKIIYFIGKDTTAYKATENQYQLSADLYRNLYNQTPAMVHSIGPDGCLLSVSDLWLKNMGYKRKEIIGTKSIEYLTAESQEYAKNIALPKFLINGKITDVPYDFITKEGKIINTLLSAIAEYDENGNLARTLAVLIDISLQKKTEKELLLSEQRLSKAINFAPFPAMIHSEGKVLQLSNSWTELTGYTIKDIPTIEEWSKKAYKDGAALSKEYIEKLYTIKSRVKDGEWEIKTKCGNYRVWELSTSPISTLPNGNSVVISMASDITDRIQVEKEVKNEKAFSESVMNAAKDIIYLFDPETSEAIYWNQAIMDIMNLSYEEVKEGLAGSGSFHRSEDLTKIGEGIKECVKFGQSNIQVDAYVKDKHYIPIDYNLSLIDRGDGKKLICVVGRDISKAKQAEKLLRQSKHLLEASQSIAKVGGWELDLATNNLFWTAETYRIHDTSPEEFNPTVDAGIGYYLPESKQIISEALQVAMEKGEGYDLVLETYTTKGRKIDVRTTCEVSFMKGKPSKLIGIFQDITTAKRIENDLIKAKDKAEESDRLKSAFLANMSHEIRTPMNGILGFTDLLKSPNLSGEKQQKYIDIIEKSGARMLTTIHNIIDISIIESGQIQLSLSDIDLNTQMDELYEFFYSETKKKGIQLSLKKGSPNQPLLINTDEDKLNSILTNLLKNAIKYTKSGSISFGYELNDAINPTLLHFSIIDTGIGIPKEKQSTVFQRFMQGENEDQMIYEGSGLGLSIANAYVEKLGGEIKLESQVGVGSHFSFTLPLIESDLKLA